MKTEQEFVNENQAKYDRLLVKDLERIQHTGQTSKAKIDKYSQADLIILSSPTPKIGFNHWKLTDKGITELALAKARLRNSL